MDLLSPSEEMDLLVKWLRVESKKHALSIRASIAHAPAKGLKKFWERLDERFGSPEMIHTAVLKMLNDFPKLRFKDNAKLYELSDIFGEIEFLKENPMYDTLLAYFDSSVGVSPIVSKLPYNIQEKWTTRANTFKRTHDVTYLRGWVFTESIHELARIRNDPGFMYSNTQFPAEKTVVSRRPVIASKKTDINKDIKQPETVQDSPRSRSRLKKEKHF